MENDCAKDDIARLTYLERCIKESMRLFPPVPFVGRNLENDLQMGEFGPMYVLYIFGVAWQKKVFLNWRALSLLPDRIESASR